MSDLFPEVAPTSEAGQASPPGNESTALPWAARLLTEAFAEDPELQTLTIAELAFVCSRSERWVRRALRDAGLTLQKSKSAGEILVEVFREDPSLSIEELAEASGHSAAWVRRTLRRAGVVLQKENRK